MNYFYRTAANTVVGPVIHEELVTARQHGQVTDETPVIEEGAAEWRTYQDLVPRAAPLPPPAPPAVHPRLAGLMPGLAKDARCSRPRPLKTVALIAGVFLATLLSVAVRGQVGRPSGGSSGPASNVAAGQAPETFKPIAYEGKQVPYRVFLPDYWTALARPLDENADRAFVGPHGLVLSLYRFEDLDSFRAGLQKTVPITQAYQEPGGQQSGLLQLAIDNTAVHGVRMARNVFVSPFGSGRVAWYPACSGGHPAVSDQRASV